MTSDDERMVICEEEGDDDVMGVYCNRNNCGILCSEINTHRVIFNVPK